MRRAKVESDPRAAAWRALCDYDARHPPWDPLLSRALRGLSGSDRGLGAMLLSGALRHRRRLDHVIEAASGRALAQIEMPVLNLLRVGALQLLLLRVPAHAAVHETVELTKRHVERAAGFVNAALREIQRMEDERRLPEMPLAVRHSIPDDIAEAMRALLPEMELDEAARALNEDLGPLSARFNPFRGDPAATSAKLGQIEGTPHTPHRLVPGAWDIWLRDRFEVLQPLLDAGEIVIQDPASQVVALLVAPRPGQRIVDLCAAPGGKASHLAALMGGEGVVLATDRNRERLSELRANVERLGAKSVEVVDWGMAEMLMAAPQPDAILIDAPCTGWGTIRHKPDLKWRPHAPRKLAEAQRALLEHAAPHLSAGGAIVYSVCSFLPEETSGVVEGFLAEHPEYGMEDARTVLPAEVHGTVEDRGWVRTWPHRHACDAFFMARLTRTR